MPLLRAPRVTVYAATCVRTALCGTADTEYYSKPRHLQVSTIFLHCWLLFLFTMLYCYFWSLLVKLLSVPEVVKVCSITIAIYCIGLEHLSINVLWTCSCLSIPEPTLMWASTPFVYHGSGATERRASEVKAVSTASSLHQNPTLRNNNFIIAN